MMNKKAQAGVSLVELMIALVIGLFLVAGVLSIFTSSKRTYLYQQSQSVESEYQRLAATVFGVMLRQAGHATMDANGSYAKNEIFDNPHTNNTAASLSLAVGQLIAGFEEGDGTPNVPHDDVIRYQFMGGEGIFGCDGVEIPDETTLRREELQIVDGKLNCNWVMQPASGSNTAGNFDLIGDNAGVSAAQKLTVESLNITYGVDTLLDDESIDRYMNAADVHAGVLWKSVKSAVIEMTMKSGLRDKPITMTYVVEFPNLIGAVYEQI